MARRSKFYTDAAAKIIAGTARSMGITIKG